MPTSYMGNILPIMNEIWRLRPSSTLELGVGIGKYGLLMRELLDIGQGRLFPEEWVINIVGVEGFEKYANPLHMYFYSHVFYEDFTTKPYKGFDLVLLIDSLEHIDKATGHKLLDQLLADNKRVIVSCPTGQHYAEQGAVFDNEFERHRAHWTPDDFEMRGGHILQNEICVIASIRGNGQGKDNLWIHQSL